MGTEAGKPTLATPRPRRRPPPQPSSSAGALARRPPPAPRRPPPPPRRRNPTAAFGFGPQAPTPVQALTAPAKAKTHRALSKAEANVVIPHDSERHVAAALRHFGIDSQAKVDALPPASRHTVQRAIAGDAAASQRVIRGYHVNMAKNELRQQLPGRKLDFSRIGDDRLAALGASLAAQHPVVGYGAPKPVDDVYGSMRPKSLLGSVFGAIDPTGVTDAGERLLSLSRQANASINASKALHRTLLGRAVADLLELPPNLIPSAADMASAGWKAAHGHPGELISTGKGMLKPFTDPIGSFKEHPGATALAWSGLVAGPEALAERGAFGSRVAAATSRERAPLQVQVAPEDVRIVNELTGEPTTVDAHGHPIEIPRQYGRPVVQPLQKAAERYARSRGRDPNVASQAQLRSALYGGGRFFHWLGGGKNVFAGTFKPGLVDQFAGDWEAIRRLAAGHHVTGARNLMKQVEARYGEGAQDVMPYIVQHIIGRPGTLKADLEAELNRLKLEESGGAGMRPLGTHVKLDDKALEANRTQQATIERLLGNDKLLADPKLAFENSDEIASMLSHHAVELNKIGGLTDEGRAAMFPGVQAHFGAVTAPEAERFYLNAEEQVREWRQLLAEQRAQGAPMSEINYTHKLLATAEAEKLRWGPFHPNAERAHRVAQAEEQVAAANMRIARENHEARIGERNQLVGAQRVQRGVRGAKQAKAAGRKPLAGSAKATKGEKARLAAANENLSRAKAQRRLAEGNHREARDRTERRRIEKGRRQITGMRTQEGLPFESADMLRLLNERSGGRPIGFLSHYLPKEWKQSVFSRTGARAGIPKPRSGEAFRTGAARMDAEALLHQVYDTSNRLVAHQRVNDLVDRFGIGRFADAGNAGKVADHFTKKYGRQFVVYNVGPNPAIQRLADRELGTGARADPISAARYSGDPHLPAAETGKEPPKYIVLPEEIASRLDQWNQAAHGHTAAAPLRWFTNKWRRAALYTSPRWIAGTPQENIIRLAFRGINPLAAFGGPSRALDAGARLADRYQRILDDESRPQRERDSARKHLANLSAGTHYGSLLVNTIRDEDLPWIARTAPARAWRKWTDEVLGPRMTHMETNVKQALHGKDALKEATTFRQRILGINEEVGKLLDQHAERNVDPNFADHVARQVMESAGNWTHLTPSVRSAVQTLTPFGLWWLNSLKFIYRTLPRDHPMTTGILAALSAADIDRHPGRVGLAAAKPYLGGTFHVKLPGVGGISVDPTYYSPAGIDVDPGKVMTDMIAPQFKSELLAAMGLDPLTLEHQTIKRPGAAERTLTDPEKGAEVLNTLLEGITPGLRQTRQLIEQGGTPYPTANLLSDALGRLGLGPSQIKPGTERGLLDTLYKILSPIKYFRDPRTGKLVPVPSNVPEVTGRGGAPRRRLPGGGGVTPAERRALQPTAAERRGLRLTPAERRALIGP